MRADKLKWTMLGLMLAALLPHSAWADSSQALELREATEVLRDIMDIPETSIPPSLMNSAEGIAVIPNVVKVGFIVGGRSGDGVVVVRDPDSGKWGYPSFVTLTGGSFGWQIGAQSSDVILVFKSRRGVMNMVNGKFTLGADAAVAAGPVGRNTAAATDTKLVAEIYSYSRSRGLFAGLSLDGSSMEIDYEANNAYYGRDSSVEDILAGKPEIQPGREVEQFMKLIQQHTDTF